MGNVYEWFFKHWLPKQGHEFWLPFVVITLLSSAGLTVLGNTIPAVSWLRFSFAVWVALAVMSVAVGLLYLVIEFFRSMRRDYLMWKQDREDRLMDMLRR